MVIFKDNVRIKVFSDTIFEILSVLHEIDQIKPAYIPDQIVVTSINDSEHLLTSKHYKDQAVDVRSHNFASSDAKHKFIESVTRRLGDGYSMIFEDVGQANEHFHIQVKIGL